MPQVTVYIRNKDLPKWKSVIKKSEFIHKALWVDETPMYVQTLNINPVIKPIKKSSSTSSARLCKIHGTPLTTNGKCLQKKCKYS